MTKRKEKKIKNKGREAKKRESRGPFAPFTRKKRESREPFCPFYAKKKRRFFLLLFFPKLPAQPLGKVGTASEKTETNG